MAHLHCTSRVRDKCGLSVALMLGVRCCNTSHVSTSVAHVPAEYGVSVAGVWLRCGANVKRVWFKCGSSVESGQEGSRSEGVSK